MILFCNWAAHHRSIQRNGEYWWIGCIIRSCLLGRENAIEYGTRYTNKNLLSHLFHSYIHSHARQIGCIHRYHSFDQNRFAQCDDRIVEIRKKWICAAKRSMFKRTRSHNWCGLYFWICAAVANKHSMLRTYIFFFSNSGKDKINISLQQEEYYWLIAYCIWMFVFRSQFDSNQRRFIRPRTRKCNGMQYGSVIFGLILLQFIPKMICVCFFVAFCVYCTIYHAAHISTLKLVPNTFFGYNLLCWRAALNSDHVNFIECTQQWNVKKCPTDFFPKTIFDIFIWQRRSRSLYLSFSLPLCSRHIRMPIHHGHL